MEFKAKNYQKRKDIERDVLKNLGKNIEVNREGGHIIKGKRDELKNLLLDDTKAIWGVSVEITDTPTKPKKGKSTKPLRQGKPKAHQIKR